MEQLVARRAHNPKVAGSSPAPATTRKKKGVYSNVGALFCFTLYKYFTRESFYFCIYF
jgi:hypothetical protein